MFLARIDGSVTATIKHPSLEGCRMLIGQRLEPDGSVTGEPIAILDPLRARAGTIVLVSTDGDLARRMVKDNRTPSRLVVVGIVDRVHLAQGPGAEAPQGSMK